MMQYTIIQDNDKDGFESQVSEYIENGWTPLGGVAIAYHVSARTPLIYLQAMGKKG